LIVDSSVWIEIFTKGDRATECQHKMRGNDIFVPVIVLFEVYRKIKQKISDDVALEVVASLSKNKVLLVDRDIALLAADLSIEYKLAMADSMVYAFARDRSVDLLTLDHDFINLPNVVVVH
jgi:toxin FitB